MKYAVMTVNVVVAVADNVNLDDVMVSKIRVNLTTDDGAVIKHKLVAYGQEIRSRVKEISVKQITDAGQDGGYGLALTEKYLCQVAGCMGFALKDNICDKHND